MELKCLCFVPKLHTETDYYRKGWEYQWGLRTCNERKYHVIIIGRIKDREKEGKEEKGISQKAKKGEKIVYDSLKKIKNSEGNGIYKKGKKLRNAH